MSDLLFHVMRLCPRDLDSYRCEDLARSLTQRKRAPLDTEQAVLVAIERMRGLQGRLGHGTGAENWL